MFTSSSMELLSMVIFKENLDDVVSHLVKLGTFQPVDVQKVEAQLKSISPLRIEKESADCQAIEITLRDICRKLSLSLVYSKEIKPFSVEKIKETFEQINPEINSLTSEKEELISQLKVNEALFLQIKDYFIFPVKRTSPYSFLEIAIGNIEEKNIPVLERSLTGIPHLFYPFRRQNNKVTVLLIGLKRDRAVIDKTLRDLAWQEIELPGGEQYISKEAADRLKEKIDECRVKINNLDEQIKQLANDFRESLSQIYSSLCLRKSLLEAEKYSYSTDKTVILAGWVLSEDKDNVISEIKKIAKTTYVERTRAEDVDIPKEDIPVKLKHSRIFKPFELLIDSYGIPRYGTIDPTIFVAISFLLMFGAMFGDLGQGLVIAFLGLFLKKAKNEKVKQASALLMYCGASSSIFGILYGSIFGFEELIPAFWIRPMENILEIFKISVFFGVAIITFGIILNIINALRDKDYIKAIFDKAGLITGIVYWLAIAFVSKLFVAKANIPSFYLIAILSGFALIFLKPFIEIFLGHKKEKESFFVTFMESIVDVLEVVMGYLANTVSFIRVAAFALAHIGLFFAIFELSRMMKGVGAGALSIFIIVLGNIFIILLEGLVVSIQSLRLNYYEFFSKFFVSGKQIFKPLTIREG